MKCITWILPCLATLVGCAGSHVGIANAPDAKEINLGSESIYVSKASGVWEATYRDYLAKFIYVDQRGLMQRKLGLIAAIESASRCKVVDSTLDQMGISMVASVNCQPATAATSNVPVSRSDQPSNPTTRALGRDTLQAEQHMKAQQCNPSPSPALLAKGPGYETYTAVCANGDTLVVRCEHGNCRSLK